MCFLSSILQTIKQLQFNRHNNTILLKTFSIKQQKLFSYIALNSGDGKKNNKCIVINSGMHNNPFKQRRIYLYLPDTTVFEAHHINAHLHILANGGMS